MKKVCLFLLFFVSLSVYGQEPIEYKEIFLGYEFYRAGQTIDINTMKSIMSGDPEAYPVIKSAKALYATGNVLSFIGGGFIGWPVGTALGGGEPEWGLAIIGAGIVAVALPVAYAGSQKAKEAADIYNYGLGITHRPGVQWQVGVTASGGFGVAMTF